MCMHNEVWGCAEIFPSSVHEVISKQYLLHAIFKVGQSWSSIWRNFAVFYLLKSFPADLGNNS